MNTKKIYTYYDVLGVSPLAKDTDVRRSYYALAKRWHPDHNPGNPEAAGNAVRILNQAYTAIKTEELRTAYNHFLTASRQNTAANNNVSWERRNKTHKTPGVLFSHLKEILWPIAPKQGATHHG